MCWVQEQSSTRHYQNMDASGTYRTARMSLLLLWCASAASAFYVPGVKPVAYEEGDYVPLKVNALSSTRTQIPRDYYLLPFCVPDGEPRMASQSLGEFLTGNKIQSSPYTDIQMKKDLYCQVVCDVTLDKLQAAKLR
jgi:transmembrane 9 superfamily member 2/4